MTPEVRAKLGAVCNRLGLQSAWLDACITFESQWNPQAVNPVSGATGLIQYMPSTARSLGTTVESIRQMSALDQLDWVEKYFQPYIGKIKTFADCYMAILYPIAIGWPDNSVLFGPDSKAYLQNRGLDIDHDGNVTKGEAASFPAKYLGATPVPNTRTNGTTKGAPMGAVAVPLLEKLIPMVLGLFAPKLQAQVGKISGQSPDTAANFMQALIAQVGSAIGIPVVDDATAVQAVGKLTAAPEAEKTAAVESLSQWMSDYVDHVSPLLDKMAAYDQATWGADVAGQDAAAARGQKDSFDLGPMIAAFVFGMIFLAMLGISAVMIIQTWMLPNHEPTTALLTLVGPLLGTLFSGYVAIVAYRFGEKRVSSATAASTEVIRTLAAKANS